MVPPRRITNFMVLRLTESAGRNTGILNNKCIANFSNTRKVSHLQATQATLGTKNLTSSRRQANFRITQHEADRQSSMGGTSFRTRRITNKHETSRSHHSAHSSQRDHSQVTNLHATRSTSAVTSKRKWIRRCAQNSSSNVLSPRLLSQECRHSSKRVIVNSTRSKSGLMNCQTYLINLKVHRVS